MTFGRSLPCLLLLGYGLAFGAASFGVALPAFDDHPGQLYRLWHVLEHGLAPWTWNPGWWAGYPELQFYPPGFFYLGALLHYGALALLPLGAIYQTLLWLGYLAPGVTTFLALARLLGNGWLALPAGFVALTLSAGLASGVEGGVHIGMLPARLGWALLPLLFLALARWIDDDGPPPWGAGVLVAAIALVHPAHLPAAAALVALAALSRAGRGRRLLGAVALLAVAAALTAFWTLPLIARLANTRALAWGRLAPLETLGDHPLLVALLVLAALAPRLARSPAERVIARWPWAAIAVVALDAGALEPLGIRWLPADRISDGAWLAVILAGGLAGGRLITRAATARRWPIAGLTAAALAATALLGVPGKTLSLWPRAAEWPSYAGTARGLRLDDLWTVLRRGPEGRVLFLRSGVPLVYGTEWWRPHSHVTALTPMRAGRDIVNGTFTHPSPVAALVYRGDAGPGALTMLAEQTDGRSLFGRPLAELDAESLARHADRLGVSVVVALDEDLPRLRALDDHPAFVRRSPVGPFLIYERRSPVSVPARMAADRWRIELAGDAGAWVPARLAYYPLWRAERQGARLETRRGEFGDLEVRLDERAGPVELVYAAGAAEVAGLAVSAAGILATGLAWWRSRRLPSSIPPPNSC